LDILLIHQAFVSPDEAGGTRHFEFARRCVDLGFRFTIVASDLSYLSGRRYVQQKSLFHEQDLNGMKILRAYTYPALHRSFVWRVIAFLSFMITSMIAALKAGPFDVVMGTSPPIFQCVSAWLVARARRCPFLLEVRDLWPEFAIDMGIMKNRFLIILSRWLEKFLYGSADHIVVNSPAYRDYLLEKGVAALKITLIPNGVDTGMFGDHSEGNCVRQQLELHGKFVVTYAGALGMANDIPTILRAAKRLSNCLAVHFLIVGDGKERSNLETLAQSMGLENVRFLGAHPKKEIASILAASDACTATLMDIPMFRTTYPNKVFDYMAAGRPIILGIDGVIRQVVEAAGCGIFVTPGDDARFAQAVKELEANRDRAIAMGTAGLRYVAEHFDRNKHANQFIALAEHLAR